MTEAPVVRSQLGRTHETVAYLARNRTFESILLREGSAANLWRRAFEAVRRWFNPGKHAQCRRPYPVPRRDLSGSRAISSMARPRTSMVPSS